MRLVPYWPGWWYVVGWVEIGRHLLPTKFSMKPLEWRNGQNGVFQRKRSWLMTVCHQNAIEDGLKMKICQKNKWITQNWSKVTKNSLPVSSSMNIFILSTDIMFSFSYLNSYILRSHKKLSSWSSDKVLPFFAQKCAKKGFFLSFSMYFHRILYSDQNVKI